jgi:hypothetical protein
MAMIALHGMFASDFTARQGELSEEARYLYSSTGVVTDHCSSMYSLSFHNGRGREEMRFAEFAWLTDDYLVPVRRFLLHNNKRVGERTATCTCTGTGTVAPEWMGQEIT